MDTYGSVNRVTGPRPLIIIFYIYGYFMTNFCIMSKGNLTVHIDPQSILNFWNRYLFIFRCKCIFHHVALIKKTQLPWRLSCLIIHGFFLQKKTNDNMLSLNMYSEVSNNGNAHFGIFSTHGLIRSFMSINFWDLSFLHVICTYSSL